MPPPLLSTPGAANQRQAALLQAVSTHFVCRPVCPKACPIEKQGMLVRRSVPAAMPLLRDAAHAAAVLSGAPAAAAERRALCSCACFCQMQQQPAREQGRRASAVTAGDRLTLLCQRLLAQPSLSNRSAAARAAGSAAGTAVAHHAAMLPSHLCQPHTCHVILHE